MSDHTLDDVLGTTVKSGTDAWYEVTTTSREDTVELIAVDATNTDRSIETERLLEHLNNGDWEPVYEGTTQELVTDGGRVLPQQYITDAAEEFQDYDLGGMTMSGRCGFHTFYAWADEDYDGCANAWETALYITLADLLQELWVDDDIVRDARGTADPEAYANVITDQMENHTGLDMDHWTRDYFIDELADTLEHLTSIDRGDGIETDGGYTVESDTPLSGQVLCPNGHICSGADNFCRECGKAVSDE
ncbi:hypothetical protein C440_05577 [Haloferax mucosum ATCC BAA-1512]|uniref:Uncharacterized protein n=1 Tax=Haloferax mucosum ATCC BAA-1512 TaxID=662479 RepID=M0IGZ6_9EURY|nr:hypothetical protein [Haloferax mucosum]ELZ96035.1 hypothetical protein C440_05577 [Haloferax mucosum ATCC BAA-1512]